MWKNANMILINRELSFPYVKLKNNLIVKRQWKTIELTKDWIILIENQPNVSLKYEKI